MPAAKTDKPSLVDLIAEATPEDLQGIDAKIADLEKQQESVQNQIDALRKMRKIVDVRLNGRPPRKPRGPSKKKGGATPASASPAAPQTALPPSAASQPSPQPTASPLAEKIFDQIQRRGPQTPAALGRTLAKNVGEINIAISSCTWFTRSPDGTISIMQA